jgi:hypothetical protein
MAAALLLAAGTGAIGLEQQAGAVAAFETLAPAFVENRGQADPQIRYYASGHRYTFQLTRDSAVLTFLDAAAGRAGGGVVLAMQFQDANPSVALEATRRVAGEVNYMRGSDPGRWHLGLSRYAEVIYRNLWPGIDLTMRGEPGELKYEFRVRPGGVPSDIRIAYTGADGLTIGKDGALLVETSMGVLRDAPPIAWQMIDGVRSPIDTRYALGEDRSSYSFDVRAGYRRDQELVIDPGLEYSTFLGGTSHDFGTAIAVDSGGNAYIIGTTQSTNFPTRVGSFDRTFNGGVVDVFVTKLNPTGTALIYSTYLGGTPAAVPAGGSDPFEFGRAIAVDAAGNAYVAGQTTSANFPTTSGAFDRSLNIGTFDTTDAFVTKLNAAGSGLVYSTFLGGTDIDDALAIAVDESGQAYVGGETGSTNFPTTAGAFDRTRDGAFDAFVVKFNAAGSALVYSTFIGGTEVDFVEDIAVSGGNAYVGGSTRSPNFPTTAGAFDTTQNGFAFDAFVLKLNPAGSALVYSTILGGSEAEFLDAIAIDVRGDAYVSGGTASTDFPTTVGAFDTTPDGSDAFVTKLNATGSALLYSTVIGGSNGEGAAGLALDAADNAWVTGGTGSPDFPTTPDAFDRSHNGSGDVFVTALNSTGSAIVYSTFLGAASSETGSDIALDSAGAAYITGRTISVDFPTTQGAFDVTFHGDPAIFWADGFVAKFGDGPFPPVNAPGVPGTPTLAGPPNGDTPPQPITFHWNVTTNATSYQIQIDNSSGFTAPLVHNQSNIPDTRVAVSGLAVGTPHFWRVRGVNSAGVAGPFSAVRSFTPGEAPPAAVLGSLDANPSTVVGGEQSFGTAVLSTPAPQGGAVISLSSSHPNVASVPPTTTASSNEFTASFVINTAAVSTSTTVTITGQYNGSTRTASLTVTPGGPPPPSDTTPPTVSIGNPANGATVSGTTTITASASDNVGVTRVEFLVDGALLSTDTSAPYSASWNTTSATNGSHAITARAFDAANNQTTSSVVNVTVNNTAPPPPPPPTTATLTVTATGRSGERVTSNPAGINVSVGTTGSASFNTGTSITLSVTNGRDAIWSGACSSGGNKRRTCVFTVNGNASVNANVQ